MFRIEYCTCPKIAIRHYKVFSGERVVCCMARLITGNAFDISAVLEEDARQKNRIPLGFIDAPPDPPPLTRHTPPQGAAPDLREGQAEQNLNLPSSPPGR